jgi:sugar phosphate isomerase/epimerase
MTRYPRIHLTMDNSFATKRWTTPDEWARIIRDLGVTCIEASADTEADPFYCGPQYLEEWLGQVREASEAHGVRVVNFFTGYTTYRTLGLAHEDARVRRRIVDDWLGVVARLAAGVHAGIGFYIHAFPERVLEDPSAYREAKEKLYDTLAEVARLAGDAGAAQMMVEQMYTPHQIPWTLDGTREYLLEVSRRSGFPAYLALDTGHQTGQPRFLRPSSKDIERCLETAATAPYLGSESAYALFEEASRGRGGATGPTVERIESEMDRYPHLFASRGDCDLYRWLEELGCYSPVVHLQQTNGRSSSHLPFVAANNEQGIVRPPELLQALARSYERAALPGMPPRTDDVYLTFEIFPHTTDRRRDILPALAESVRYWRRWVPEDGARLDALVRG